MDPQALPAKCSASCSVKGGTPECCIVTLLRGSSDCTILSDFPSFLTMQNHRDRYEEFEGSNTPASIPEVSSLGIVPGKGVLMECHKVV